MNISTYIPTAWRKHIYGAFAVAGVIIGAIQVGIAATGDANPEWLLVTLAVFPFLAGAIGFTASANTNKAEDDIDWSGGSMADFATEDEEVETEDN